MLKHWIEALKAAFSGLWSAGQRRASPAGNLLERAGACAGRDPGRAAELRRAALAYLGVVR